MELRVCHSYPDVLNLYGDRGNVLCLSLIHISEPTRH